MGSISLDLRSLVPWSVHFQKSKSSSQSQFHIVSQVLGFCSTLRVDLKQNHCDLALFRLVNLVQSFVSAVQSGRHKELGRPGKFQQTLPSDSLKLQTVSQHF